METASKGFSLDNDTTKNNENILRLCQPLPPSRRLSPASPSCSSSSYHHRFGSLSAQSTVCLSSRLSKVRSEEEVGVVQREAEELKRSKELDGIARIEEVEEGRTALVQDSGKPVD